MKKRIVSIIVCCFLLSGCGNIEEGAIVTSGDQFTPISISEDNPPPNIPEISDTDTTSRSEPVSVQESEIGTSLETAAETEEETQSTTESSSQTELPVIEEPETEAEIDVPKWTEAEASGELYVNTNNIYSRISAIQGSEKVTQYKLNDKVTVTAKTDTDYYKLSDGTFIHADYLSKDKIDNGDYSALTSKGFVIKRIDGITYVDGIMIANKTYSLPEGYDPGIRKEAADALAEMQEAAAAEGISLFVVSGYRSYQTQKTVYAGWADRDGEEQADTYSSRAGHSDHQTGYTFDLNSLEQSFAYTKEGIWLAEHCDEFGFIIRYPEGKEMYTGYVYEPWHVRFVGKEKAEILTESGLSIEEYYGITSVYAD